MTLYRGETSVKFSIAPMLDWTDRHCRFFHRTLTKEALLYTEMLHANAVLYGPRESLLRFSPQEHPIAVQLGGADAKKLAEASKICEDFGYDEINLNVGCPSDRVQSGAFGACLMRKPVLVGELVDAMKNAVTVPVTVKCRIGVDEQNTQEALDVLGKICISAGVDAFWIHARKAWLEGLSPKQNRNIPPLDYQRVYDFKRDHPQNFVGLNGGITSLDEAIKHLDVIDAVMIGRAAYKFPEMLGAVDHLFYSKKDTNIDFPKIMETMSVYLEQHIKEGGRAIEVVKHMLGLFHGKKGAKKWRQILSNPQEYEKWHHKLLLMAFEVIET